MKCILLYIYGYSFTKVTSTFLRPCVLWCEEKVKRFSVNLPTGWRSPVVRLDSARVCVCLQVEFEWLRQYWFQGQRYTRFCSWWTKPMEQLEKDWKLMEMMVSFVWHVQQPVARSHLISPRSAAT